MWGNLCDENVHDRYDEVASHMADDVVKKFRLLHATTGLPSLLLTMTHERSANPVLKKVGREGKDAPEHATTRFQAGGDRGRGSRHRGEVPVGGAGAG
jgi:hypothetical protein